MLEATKLIVAVKNIETPDERHGFENASVNVVNLPGVTIARTVYQPGWKWSADVKPVVGTEACQAAHTGYILSGWLHARMDDGREYDFGPGDAHVVSAGHDAWVEGDEPCVVLDLAFTGRALAGHAGPAPAGSSSGSPATTSSASLSPPSASTRAAPMGTSSPPSRCLTR
jgi:hypothetical protein